MYGSTIGKKLLLCATEIQLSHPLQEDQIVSAKVELPTGFTAFMEREEGRFVKYEKWIAETGIYIMLEMCKVLDTVSTKKL